MHSTTQEPTFNAPSTWFHAMRDWQATWYYNAIGYLVLAAVCLVAMGLDDRLFNGISTWAKPFKFALSIGIYFLTLAWFAQYLPAGSVGRKTMTALVAIPVAMGLFEMGYILFQASIAEASHFNFSSNFHAMMYSLMGLGATLMVLILAWMAVLIARRNDMSDPMVFAVVVGLVLTFVLGGGFGGYLGSAGGHWVQTAATDANGIPFFKWATDGGDLRVAHFFGMHAMQALPMFAFLLPKKLPSSLGIALVVAFGCAYSAFSTMTFLQAINGDPFLVL